MPDVDARFGEGVVQRVDAVLVAVWLVRMAAGSALQSSWSHRVLEEHALLGSLSRFGVLTTGLSRTVGADRGVGVVVAQ